MNREELKKHINNFRLNLPQGMKFAVIAQSSAVLESSKDLHCEYLYVAMERAGHFWALQTYGEMETRLEGTWTGNSWLKVYPCYNEEHLVMIDGAPCQYVGETNPFQDDPTLERPVPKLEDFLTTGSQTHVVRKMADILKEGMVESRSASKSLLRNPISLKDTPYGGFQAYRRTKLGSSEYRARKLVLIEDELKFTEDEVNNRRRLNNASLYLKVLHKRAVRGLDRAVAEESTTARCTQPPGGHIEPEDHTVDSIAVALGSLRELKEEGEE